MKRALVLTERHLAGAALARLGRCFRSLHWLLVFTALLHGAVANAIELALQVSESDGVSVAVKPLDVSKDAAAWTFQVSFSAKGKSLSDDLPHGTFIVDRAGKKRLAALSWNGDAPGAHLRKGVLSFTPVKPFPKAIELRIERPGERAPRLFRWDLDCPCNDPKMHAT